MQLVCAGKLDEPVVVVGAVVPVPSLVVSTARAQYEADTFEQKPFIGVQSLISSANELETYSTHEP
ncbi:hypothetical protein SLS57_011907 [Botryosphaeria dothidea]